MTNYLAAAQSISNAVTAGQNIDVTGNTLQNAGINAGVSAVSALAAGQDPISAALGAGIGAIPGASSIASGIGALGSALGVPGLEGLGGAGSSGTKPKALHTEYAGGKANGDSPYGSGNDIVFYLERAGKAEESALDDPAATGEDFLGSIAAGEALGGLSEAAGGALGAAGEALGSLGGITGITSAIAVAADVASGLGLPSNIQSPLNQVATAASLLGSVAGAQTFNSGLMGAMTGLAENLDVLPGVSSSTAASVSSLASSVTNILGAGQSSAKTSPSSFAASEAFFSQTLTNAFNVGASQNIEDALSKAPVAELSSQMAKFSGGVSSTVDFIQGINHGNIGYTTQQAAAAMQRMGPQGLSKEVKK